MIEAYSFGKMCINGSWHTRDLRIKGTTVLSGWWRRNGHSCAVEDIEDLLDDHPDILLLGQGTPGMMRTTPELQRLLRERGIELIEQPTTEAVHLFNELYRKKNLVAGFHLTC